MPHTHISGSAAFGNYTDRSKEKLLGGWLPEKSPKKDMTEKNGGRTLSDDDV